MPQLSLRQAKVVDPILTRYVQLGPKQGRMVGNLLFPPVPVGKRSGRIIKHSDEAFALMDTRRTPGARTKRVAVVYGSEYFELYQDKIEGELPIELLEEAESETDLPINLQRATSRKAKNVIDLRLEYDQLSLASSPDAYGSNFTEVLSGSSQWTDSTSRPKAQMNEWREAIRSETGVYPNTAIFSPKAFNALDIHPEVRDQFKYVKDDSLTIGMVQRFFNIEKCAIATCLVKDPITGLKRDILQNEVILAYVNQELDPEAIEPSFGYTYTLKGYPIALPSYYEENRETWLFPVKAERAPLITYNGAGFLVQNVTQN
jgi:hypothetical protein